MKLAFKNWSFGFSEKDVPIRLNIGTLEAVCKALKIEFWQIGETIKKNNFDFMVQLLYQGYITACKESYKKPKHTESQAILWNEHISKESQKEFIEMVNVLFGEIEKMTGAKKKVAVKKG